MASTYFELSEGLRVGEYVLEAGVSHCSFDVVDERREEIGLSFKGVWEPAMMGRP
jgi:hypothetical protein